MKPIVFSNLRMYPAKPGEMNSSKESWTIWTNEKTKVWRTREENRREEGRRSEKRKSQKKEDAGARKGRKVAKHCIFRLLCGQIRNEKVHAIVVRSTCRNQNTESTSCPEHFWNLGCWKSAHHCGAKQNLEVKSVKTDGLRPLLEVELLKKCTPYHAVVARSTFWIEQCQNNGLGPFFEVRTCVKGGQNVKVFGRSFNNIRRHFIFFSTA